MEGKVILARLLNSFQVNLQEGYQLKVEQTTTLRPVDGVPCTLVALKWSQGILVTFLILIFPVISSPELVQHGTVCVPNLWKEAFRVITVRKDKGHSNWQGEGHANHCVLTS